MKTILVLEDFMLQTYTPKRVLDASVLGAKTLKLKANSLTQLEQKLEQGLGFRVFAQLQLFFDLTEVQFGQILGMASATLRRRKESGTLSVEESHALYQVAALLERANSVIGNEAQAKHWLLQPAFALNGRTPLECAVSAVWHEEVFNLLGRLEYGAYS
jgi:putative toxin-antitoxin system antitoxin component (TIGR02293 family)